MIFDLTPQQKAFSDALSSNTPARTADISALSESQRLLKKVTDCLGLVVLSFFTTIVFLVVNIFFSIVVMIRASKLQNSYTVLSPLTGEPLQVPPSMFPEYQAVAWVQKIFGRYFIENDEE